MKSATVRAIMIFALALFVALVTTTGAEAAATKKKSSAKPPTTLPAFKPKKKKPTKMKIDFSTDAEPHETTVVVRTPVKIEDVEVSKSSLEHAALNTSNGPATPPPSAPPTAPVSAPVSAPLASSPQPVIQPTSLGHQPSPKTIQAPSPTLEQNAAALPLTPPSVASSQEMSAPTPLPTSGPDAAFAVQTPREAPGDSNLEGYRFVSRTSYLSARSSEISSELQNGATTLAAGLGHNWSWGEMRFLAEAGHGMDQAVTPQNTRHFLLRAELLAIQRRVNQFTPVYGLGFGYANISVRSYRSNGQVTTQREHANISDIFIAPIVGTRIVSNENFSLDLTIEYLTLPQANSSALGGFTGALSFGIPL